MATFVDCASFSELIVWIDQAFNRTRLHFFLLGNLRCVSNNLRLITCILLSRFDLGNQTFMIKSSDRILSPLDLFSLGHFVDVALLWHVHS